MKPDRYWMLGAFVSGALFAVAALASGENWRERLSAQGELTAGDVSAEVAFGRKIAARILGHYKTYDSPALVKYVNLVGLVLARNSGRPELDYHFMVLDSAEVNAYAAPGGYVFVTRGALQLMKDESELAGVLAHEIGHVAEMHVVKELKIKGENESVTAGLAQLVGGSSESARAAFAQAVDRGLDIIFKGEYRREDEIQSDQDAVILCALSGYDAAALARYLDVTRGVKGEVSDAGQTHPSYSTRISRINEVIVKNGIETGKPVANAKRFEIAVKSINANR